MRLREELLVSSIVLLSILGVAIAMTTPIPGSGGAGVTIAPASSTILTGGSVTLVATVSGLTSPTYQWYASGPNGAIPVSGGSALGFNDNAYNGETGTFSFYVVVTGYQSDHVQAEVRSNTAMVYVEPHLIQISLSANRTLISVGQSVLFTNSTQYSPGGNTYSYTTSGCGSASVVNNKITINTVGSCTVTEKVVSGSQSATSSVTITVTQPLVTTITPSRTYISTGQQVAFTNTTSGGTGSILNTYILYQTAPTLYYTGYTQGGYTSGKFFRSPSPVNAAYSDATLSEGFTGSTFDIHLAQGSSNGYDLGYYFLDGTLGSLATSGLPISATGAYEVNLWLNVQSWSWGSNGVLTGFGSNGGYGLGPSSPGSGITGATSFYMTAGACAGSTYTVSQLASGVCAGYNANTPIAIWIGVGPLGSAGTSSTGITSPFVGESTSSNVITFTNSGNYSVSVTSTDMSGEVNQSASVTIHVTPPLRFTSFTSNTSQVAVGGSVLFTNATAGGTGSNIYSYSVNSQSGYTQSGNKFTFSTSGSYAVTEHVSDASGEVNQTQPITIQVTSGGGSSGNYIPISSPTQLYLLPSPETLYGTNNGFQAFATIAQRDSGSEVAFELGGTSPSLYVAKYPVYISAGHSYTLNPSVEGSFDPSNTYAINVTGVSGPAVATLTLSNNTSSNTVNVSEGGSVSFGGGFSVQLTAVGADPTFAYLGAYLNVNYDGSPVPSSGTDFETGNPQTVSSNSNSLTITVDSTSNSWATAQFFLVT